MKKVLSQEEIDAVFEGTTADSTKETQPEVGPFDLSHLDRIPKSQLRAIHLVHENFVRNLASSLSAYLRSYAAMNLVSLEQISYSEFLDGLTFPTCIAYIGLSPYDGTAVLEMNMSLVFAFLEILMGSKGRSTTSVQRKITEIEKAIMQTLMRVILRDLSEAWKSVAEIDFSLQSLASEPQLMHVMAPTEAVIVIAVDVRIGAVSALMNLAIPSLFIKRLRHKFDQLQQVRKAHSSERDQAYLARVLQNVELEFKALIDAGEITTRTLLDLEPGDMLVFDRGTDQPITGTLNGREKWCGVMATRRDKLVFEVRDAISPKLA